MNKEEQWRRSLDTGIDLAREGTMQEAHQKLKEIGNSDEMRATADEMHSAVIFSITNLIRGSVRR